MRSTCTTMMTMAILATVFIGQAAADTSANLATSDNSADFILIYHDELAGSIEFLEDVKQHQGFSTLCVPTSQIQAEFGDPRDTFNPGANVHELNIRTFLVSASMFWDGPPRYALLVGSEEHYYGDLANFDYSRIPFHYPTEEGVTWRPDESYYVRNPNDDYPRLIIGRLPVVSDAEVIAYANRLALYLHRYDKGVLRLVGDASPYNDGQTDNEFYRDIEEKALADFGGTLADGDLWRFLTSDYTYIDGDGFKVIDGDRVQMDIGQFISAGDPVGLFLASGQTSATSVLCSSITNQLWNLSDAVVPVVMSVSCLAGRMWRHPAAGFGDAYNEPIVDGLLNDGAGGCLAALALGDEMPMEMFQQSSELIYEAIGKHGCRTVGEVWAYLMTDVAATTSDSYRRWVVMGDPSVEFDLPRTWWGPQQDGTIFATGVELADRWSHSNWLVAGNGCPDDLTCNIRVPLTQDFRELGKHSIRVTAAAIDAGARAEFNLFTELYITVTANTFLSYWVKADECPGGSGGLMLGVAGNGMSTFDNSYIWDQMGDSTVLSNRSDRGNEWVNYIINLGALSGQEISDIRLVYENRGPTSGELDVYIDNIEILQDSNLLPQGTGSIGIANYADDMLINGLGDARVSYVDRFRDTFSHYRVVCGAQTLSGIGALASLTPENRKYSWSGSVRFENTDTAIISVYDKNDQLLANKLISCLAGSWVPFALTFENPGYNHHPAQVRVIVSPYDNPDGKVFEARNLKVKKFTDTNPKPPKDPIPTMGAIGTLEIIPNPFNPQSQILFRTKVSGHGKVTVHDLRGSLVKTLYSGHVEAGDNVFRWSGEGGDGRAMSSGVYFVSCEVNGERVIQKLCLAK